MDASDPSVEIPWELGALSDSVNMTTENRFG